MAECRFVVDEHALVLDETPANERESILVSLADELSELRSSGECFEILSGWGTIDCVDGLNIADALNGGISFDPDICRLLLGLLGKSSNWDEDPAVAIDPDVIVDGDPCIGYGVAWARQSVVAHQGVAVVTTPQRFSAGLHGVRTSKRSSRADVYFVVSADDHKGFFRTIYELEDVPKEAFFELAARAFPQLLFAEELDFRDFQGTYRELRASVVFHLGQLHDGFIEARSTEGGRSDRISTRLGIDVSIEGTARSNERLMKHRDVKFNGRVYRCEWHSKIEHNRNRIHFHPGNETTEDRILVGIFHRHLPT